MVFSSSSSSRNSNSSSEPRSNGMIRAEQVRVIGTDGQQIGVFRLYEAITMAKEIGLDLVEINSQSSPPVCKIMEFGKFKFDQKKKEKEAARTQKTNTLGLKEVSVRPTTVAHDLQIKAEKYIQRWLNDGNKVRINVAFKGRESAHPELGEQVVSQMVGWLIPESFSVEEKLVYGGGKQMSMLITPNESWRLASKPDSEPEILDKAV